MMARTDQNNRGENRGYGPPAKSEMQTASRVETIYSPGAAARPRPNAAAQSTVTCSCVGVLLPHRRAVGIPCPRNRAGPGDTRASGRNNQEQPTIRCGLWGVPHPRTSRGDTTR